MPASETYDAIIIGTGQGGYPLAKALPQAGWKTAIVEKAAVGGFVRQRRLYPDQDDGGQRPRGLPGA